MLAALNTASPGALRDRLRTCCTAGAWIEAIIAGRPYADEAALAASSDAATAGLDDLGLDQAIDGHPRIGERTGGAWSRQEQSGVAGTGDELRAALAAANAEYERRFGHTYLVCATGRDAAELLAICQARLELPPAAERAVALAELAAINRLRLTRLLHLEATR